MAQLIPRLQTHLQVRDGLSAPPEVEHVVQDLVKPFNWLRHANRPGEPAELEWEWELEAQIALMGAIENYGQLTGKALPEAAVFMRKLPPQV